MQLFEYLFVFIKKNMKANYLVVLMGLLHISVTAAQDYSSTEMSVLMEDNGDSLQSSFCGFVRDENYHPIGEANIRIYSIRPLASFKGKTDMTGYFSIPAKDSMYYQGDITMEDMPKYHIAPFFMRNVQTVDLKLFKSITFIPGLLSTIILPVDPDPAKGRYYHLKAIEGNSPVFVREPNPSAGVPYLFIADHEFTLSLLELDFSTFPEQVVACEGNKKITFTGSYESILVGDGNDTKGGFCEFIIDQTPDCGEEKSLDGERSYYRLGACHGYFYSNLGCSFDHFILREASSNIMISTVSTPLIKNTFDLQGRRLSGVPQRGMYIRDGRKYVVK